MSSRQCFQSDYNKDFIGRNNELHKHRIGEFEYQLNLPAIDGYRRGNRRIQYTQTMLMEKSNQ